MLDYFEIQEKFYYFQLCVFIFQKKRDKLAYIHTVYLGETNPKPKKQKCCIT